MGASDIEIGLIFSIGGIGGVLGSLIGGQVQKRYSFGQAIVFLMWVHAVLFPLYALVPAHVLLGVVFALMYMTGPIYNVVQFSYRLALVPDALQRLTARFACSPSVSCRSVRFSPASCSCIRDAGGRVRNREVFREDISTMEAIHALRGEG